MCVYRSSYWIVCVKTDNTVKKSVIVLCPPVNIYMKIRDSTLTVSLVTIPFAWFETKFPKVMSLKPWSLAAVWCCYTLLTVWQATRCHVPDFPFFVSLRLIRFCSLFPQDVYALQRNDVTSSFVTPVIHFVIHTPECHIIMNDECCHVLQFATLRLNKWPVESGHCWSCAYLMFKYQCKQKC
jgi:hypothetical protein